MDSQLSVVLYSKYSKASNNFIDMLRQGGIDSIKMVCVDNADIKKRIMSDKKIEIISVPCVLVISESGTIEKYDGSTAFEWAKQLLNQGGEQYQEQLERQLYQQQQKIEQLEQEREEREELKHKKSNRRRSTERHTERSTERPTERPMKAKSEGRPGHTSIESLESEDEEDEEEVKLSSSVKKAVKTDNNIMAKAAALAKGRNLD